MQNLQKREEGTSMKRKKMKKTHDTGTVSIVVIVLIFLGVMSVQIYRLKQKEAIYAQREQNLLEQIADETQREEELEELNSYTKSMEYIKDMANKMGIVFENEIIFKESDE